MVQLSLQPHAERPLSTGAVNGKPALFILDTGAWATIMSEGEAQRLGVKLDRSSSSSTEDIGGDVRTVLGHSSLTLGETVLQNQYFTVVTARALDNDASALIGRDILARRDLEINLSENSFRTEQLEGCTPSNMVHFMKSGSVVRLQPDGDEHSAILFNVLLNGHVVPAELDSGLPQSLVTISAARTAGADVIRASAHEDIHGLAGAKLDARVAKFDSFTLGDETIRNAKLVVSDLWKGTKVEKIGTRLGSVSHATGQPRMLLGADFLRAHHVMVANSLGLLIFRYTGGPVFKAKSAQPPSGGLQPPAIRVAGDDEVVQTAAPPP